MTPNYDLYAGYYQGLAWTQGLHQAPLRLQIPDELNSHTGPVPFDRDAFFEVVADLDDEGGIHYWEATSPDTYLLHCTEDSSPHIIPDTAFHASAWIRIKRRSL